MAHPRCTVFQPFSEGDRWFRDPSNHAVPVFCHSRIIREAFGRVFGRRAVGEEDFQCDLDCNGNDIPDYDEIVSGASKDCDLDGWPDECEVDTDHDGLIDPCDNCPGIANLDQADDDDDGIGDVCDACPRNVPGVPIDETGCSTLNLPGDLDRDADVDLSDFGLFQVCMTGSGVLQNDPVCNGAKLNGDGSVDASDVVLFRACMSGPGVLGDSDCTE